MDNRKINVEEAKQQITELKNVREELEKVVSELETQFLAEFSNAYDSQRAQELKANIDAMKVEIDSINKETNTITQISEEYVRSSEATDVQ
jgi:hypothetical protein